MTRRVVLLMFALWPCLALAPTGGPPAPGSLTVLIDRRLEIARALSGPPFRCVQRRDTDHVTFHGCIDWHSSVHGVWSLVAFTGMTGDRRYQPLISGKLEPALIGREMALLAEQPGFEMPYGRAWFLRLVIDDQAVFGEGRLLPMGDAVARSMLDNYRRNAPRPFSYDYDNASWALANLLDYVRMRKWTDVEAAVVDLVRRHFIADEPRCGPDRDGRGFMSTCLNWAWLVSKVLPDAQFEAWLQRFLPPASLPQPVTAPRGAHQFGMNFSRAWALWGVYKASRNPAYRESYVRHFWQGYSVPSNWDGDYLQVGHWVAQFGMFALQPLFKEASK